MSNTTNKNIEERTSVETSINTIGWAILVQSLIKYGAFIVIVWLVLLFANDWVLALVARH